MKTSTDMMGKRPVFPLLMAMSLPAMLSMLIQSLYNIVDSMFVAKLGEDALTAVSLAYPLQNLVLSLAVGFGVAVNSCIARGLGAGKKDEVDRIAAHGVLFSVIHSLLFLVMDIFLTRPFLQMFTDSQTVLEYACQYTYIVVGAAFACLFHLLIEKMFQAIGSMLIPMIMQAVGAIVNIILDPILIFGWLGFPAMGVVGAAVATVIGQATALLLSVFFFVKKCPEIHISFKGFQLESKLVKQLYSVAVPSTMMTALPSVLVSILNGILTGISQTAVAFFGIYYKFQTFVYMPTNGLIQGMRPIVSYNYGAGLYGRMKETVRKSMLVIGIFMLAGMLICMLLPGQILDLFSAGEEMRKIGIPALRIISSGFVVSAVGVTLSGTFEAVGKGTSSLAIALIRQLILIPPLSLLLIEWMGLNGVWVTFPAAEIAAAAAAFAIYRRFLKKHLISEK